MSERGSLEVTDDDFDEESLFEELEGGETEDVAATEDQIVRKYDEGQARIIIQRNDFLVPNILEMVNKKDILNISPTYQRRKRWSNKKRSHLIESLLINIPIPPIFLYEHQLAKYEVMDGQQRLDAIRGFFNNEFALSDLKKWPELNKYRFNDLPTRIQAGLSRRGIAAVIILTESGQTPEDAMEIRQYVFERLNTGGEKLNAQEIRNCIYASPFNDMIVDLARSAQFTSVWAIPGRERDEPQKVSRELARNRYYATMADCEIVLRYFALSDLEHFRGGMKRTLDNCMIRMKGHPKKECASLARQYLQQLDIAKQTYGQHLFRLPDKQGELMGRRSVPLADAVLLSIRHLRKRAEELPSHKVAVLSHTKKLLTDTGSYEVLVGRGNTKGAVEERIDLVKKVFSSIIGK